MAHERILVTVKTYPTLSRKYGETVCTAGVRTDGSWVRIYPVPFRRLEAKQRYRKFDWLECDLLPAPNDRRPETRQPSDWRQLHPVAHLGTADAWRERRRRLTKEAPVFTRLADLIAGAKANRLSLATFRPTRVLGFRWQEEERDWDTGKRCRMQALQGQHDLFEDNAWRETFRVIPKLPYSFAYQFEDASGRESELQILDWEIGALYWKCLRSCGDNEPQALAKVRLTYFDKFIKTDLHFFLGTTQQYHQIGPNPWVIVGVFPLPHERQPELLNHGGEPA